MKHIIRAKVDRFGAIIKIYSVDNKGVERFVEGIHPERGTWRAELFDKQCAYNVPDEDCTVTEAV